ncbi:MAG: hypothetical protein R6X22_04645 [Gemmatimonadota bacterium]
MKASRAVSASFLVLLLAACSSHGQRISIRTEPTGALVSLQRMGTQTISGSVAGVGGTIDGGRFTDDWLSLGNAPVEYEFDRSESEGGGGVAGTGAKVTKRYREGMVRVELAGYRTQERRVAFEGDPIDLVFTLQRVGSLP